MKTPLLECRRLSCGYGKTPILESVHLTVSPGEVLVISGPNGSGKSTLLRTMAGLQPALAGSLLLQGQALDHYERKALARIVALAPQRTTDLAWPLSVEESVLLGRSPHRGWLAPFSGQDRELAHSAMNRFGLLPLARRNASSLSGGELRRVLLARCLVQQPALLLLDEPAAYLDLHYQAELMRILRDLAREGLAVIATMHELPLAAACADRIALLHEGRLAACGSPQEVLTRELLAPVYGEQIEVFQHPLTRVPVVLPSLNRLP